MNYWQSWRYKSSTLFIAGLIFAGTLFGNNDLRTFLLNLESWGYIGAFLAGMLFVLSLSASVGVVILLVLAKTLSPLEIAIVAGLGAVAGDYIILRFLKDNLFYELKPLYMKLGGNHISNFLYKKYMRWSLPIIGAAIIASPFPDEVGIALMGISKIKTYQFALLSFVLNSIGIFVLISAFSFI